MPLGEAAARKVADRLAQLSLPADEYAALRGRQLVALPPDLRPVDEIRFENLAARQPPDGAGGHGDEAGPADRAERARLATCAAFTAPEISST